MNDHDSRCSELESQRDQAYESLHFANGTAELAIKQRDEAESALEQIRQLVTSDHESKSAFIRRVQACLPDPFSANNPRKGELFPETPGVPAMPAVMLDVIERMKDQAAKCDDASNVWEAERHQYTKGLVDGEAAALRRWALHLEVLLASGAFAGRSNPATP